MTSVPHGVPNGLVKVHLPSLASFTGGALETVAISEDHAFGRQRLNVS